MSTWKIVFGLIAILAVAYAMWKFQPAREEPTISGAPPYGESLEEVPVEESWRTKWLGWKRPDGPARVGIQVGHWQNQDVPDELERLKRNTGSSGGGKWEWEVNLAIAEEIKSQLESKGVVVDLLPATVPPEYWADVFISIHADGNVDSTVNGYKFAGPWRDLTGKSDSLVSILERHYGEKTDLVLDPNVSRNMKGYYAFAWWRYHHAIHPMTTGVIAETGFLTNRGDRRTIVENYKKSASAIVDGLIEHLEKEKLLADSAENVNQPEG